MTNILPIIASKIHFSKLVNEHEHQLTDKHIGNIIQVSMAQYNSFENRLKALEETNDELNKNYQELKNNFTILETRIQATEDTNAELRNEQNLIKANHSIGKFNESYQTFLLSKNAKLCVLFIQLKLIYRVVRMTYRL